MIIDNNLKVYKIYSNENIIIQYDNIIVYKYID